MEQEKQPEKKKNNGCLVWVALIGFVLIMSWCRGRQDRLSKPAAEQCLSAWDGSHPEMARTVKNMLNDPGSFEHVETRYIDRGSEVDLIMKFRGKNAFGGVVTETATATINKDCELIKGPVIL